MSLLATPLSTPASFGIRFAGEHKKQVPSGVPVTGDLSKDDLTKMLETISHKKDLAKMRDPSYWAAQFEKHPPSDLEEWKTFFSQGPGKLKYQTPRVKRIFAFARPKRLIQATRDTVNMIRNLPKNDRAVALTGLGIDAFLDFTFLTMSLGLWAIPMFMTPWPGGTVKRVFYHSVMSQYEADRYGDKAAKMPTIPKPSVAKKTADKKVNKSESASKAKEPAKTTTADKQ